MIMAKLKSAKGKKFLFGLLAVFIIAASVVTRATIGGATLSKTERTATSVGEAADFALYHAKETGRGGSLSVIGFHNLTRPKSYHFRKA